MRSKGIIMFKGIEKREGGTFTSDGEQVKYDPAYIVKFDEIIENKINERKLKFPVSNKVLYDKFAELRPYTQVEITCDITILQNGYSRLTPIDMQEIGDAKEEDDD